MIVWFWVVLILTIFVSLGVLVVGISLAAECDNVLIAFGTLLAVIGMVCGVSWWITPWIAEEQSFQCRQTSERVWTCSE